MKSFLKGKMKIKGKKACGWEEEIFFFPPHSCLVQGEHFLALSFLFRVLNISSALIKKSVFILKIRKILLATACKDILVVSSLDVF